MASGLLAGVLGGSFDFFDFLFGLRPLWGSFDFFFFFVWSTLVFNCEISSSKDRILMSKFCTQDWASTSSWIVLLELNLGDFILLMRKSIFSKLSLYWTKPTIK